MKNAEANPTDETLATAKTAIEAIPGGNNELAKRLEKATANLEAIKQQAAQTQQQLAQQNQVQNDADGNGIPDDSPYNNTTPEERARGAQMEAEANAQWHQGQENIQNRWTPMVMNFCPDRIMLLGQIQMEHPMHGSKAN